eukprot:3634131-Rhodomonas_salina.1
MEKKGLEFDEEEGMMMTFEEQLALRASKVHAQVPPQPPAPLPTAASAGTGQGREQRRRSR